MRQLSSGLSIQICFDGCDRTCSRKAQVCLSADLYFLGRNKLSVGAEMGQRAHLVVYRHARVQTFMHHVLSGVGLELGLVGVGDELDPCNGNIRRPDPVIEVSDGGVDSMGMKCIFEGKCCTNDIMGTRSCMLPHSGAETQIRKKNKLIDISTRQRTKIDDPRMSDLRVSFKNSTDQPAFFFFASLLSLVTWSSTWFHVQLHRYVANSWPGVFSDTALGDLTGQLRS